MTNRSISLFFVLAFSMLTAFAAVPPTKLTKDIMWEITDDGVLKVYGNGEIPDFKPQSGKAWHQKAKKFKGLSEDFKIKAIEIGEGITSIGIKAFDWGNTDKSLFSKLTNSSKSIKLSLPTSLTKIRDYAFDGLNIVNLQLPTELKSIGYCAFSYYWGGKYDKLNKLEIPESVEFIGKFAFKNMPVNKLVINGNPKIGLEAFRTEYSKKCLNGTSDYYTNLESVVITGHPSAVDGNIFGEPYSYNGEYENSITIYVYDRTLDLSNFGLAKNMDIAYGSPEEDKNVVNYVNFRMPSWDDFLAQQVAKKKMLSDEDTRLEIERKLEKWQTKGEFESTDDWKKRVNETTRKKYLDGLIADRKKQINAVKKEYNNLRKKHADEFYDALAKRETSKILSDKFTLQQYDADNQTFLIQTSRNGDILLKVPRDKAQKFKKEWPEITARKYQCIRPEFLPNSDHSVALHKIEFQIPNGDTYVYDGSTAQYAVTDINYNFAPLEIENIDASSFSSPLVAETPATKTVGGSAITRRKVDVTHNTAIVGNGGSSKTAAARRSDVDVAIPKGNTQRPNTFALVIANENYRRVASVPYALNDGAVVCEYLKTTLGLPEKNIIHVQDASLNDIKYNLQRLAEICRAYKGDASLIVYYAGHGVPDDKTKDAYLLPVDGYAESPSASGLSLASLTSALAELPTKSASLFLDACFSGGERAGAGGGMLVGARGVRIKPNKDAVSGKLVMFSATQGEETAHPYEEQQHGLFTYYLLKKLRESKGNVTLGDLTDYVTDNVERISAVNGKKQTPTVTASPENPSWRSDGL